MKTSRRYVVLVLLLAFALLLQLNTWDDEYAEVEEFRGAQLQDEVFYPLKAKSINEAGLATLVVKDATFDSMDTEIMVNDHLHLMGSEELVRDVFDASVHRDQEGKILIERNGDLYTFFVNETDGSKNAASIFLQDVPLIYDETCYLPLEDLCGLFGFAYNWDETTYAGVIGEGTESYLPAKYDLRTRSRASAIRDQGSTSTCWANAALGALESTLLPLESYHFSVDHMTKENAFSVPVSTGGDYTMAAAYLLSWDGPRDDEMEVRKHVQEVQFFEEDDLDAIKWAVYQYGGVSTSIYANVGNSNLNKSSDYNSRTNAYCYRGTQEPNHDVVIIGWDDDYKASNFSVRVPGDGAFICQNSWGKNFGEDGVFYISYYDTHVGAQSVAYTRVEDADNYDSIYQSDRCGWVGSLGYNKEKIMAANVYTADQTEMITAAGFYALGKNTSYQIYMVPEYRGVASLADRTPVASGKVEQKGYYTVDFDHPVLVDKGDRFAVVILLETPGSTLPMAIEYRSGEKTAQVDVMDGEGYISNNGLDWERVETKANGNLCLKAYGRVFEIQDKED